MNIKLKDLKSLMWHAGMLGYRLFHLIDGNVNVEALPLLWETPANGN